MKQKPTSHLIEKIFSIILLLSLLCVNLGKNDVSSAQAQSENKIFVDPLFGYNLSIAPGWNVIAPKVDALSKSKVLYGVTLLENYDSFQAETQDSNPEDLKIQIGLGPMVNTDFLNWVQQRISGETASADFTDFNYHSTTPEAISLGTLTGYTFTMTSDEMNSSVMEIVLLAKHDVVVSIGLSPANSTSIPIALEMLSSLDFSRASIRAQDFYDTPTPKIVVADLIESKPFSVTQQDSLLQSAVIHPPGWGSEAPNSPITLYMPFHDGETWQVGGGGYFYGDGDHRNTWNDYYATDWNRTAGDDLGKDVLPVAGGNVIQRQVPPCPTTAFGCYIKIDHGNGITTLYGHLSTVSRDLGGVNHWDVIGQVGSSGNSTGAHLHLQFRQNGFSTCRNNGNTCPNGESPANQQSPKPSPMNTQQGAVQLNDSYTYTSNNKNDSGPLCPSLSGEVKLYDLINCGGDSTTANGTGLWSMASSFNDRAESIAIPSGWSARLYQNDNENSNESACFASTDSNLNDNAFANGGGVGNNATWMRVYNNTNCSGGNPPVAPTPISPTNGQSFNEGEAINLSWTSTGDEYYGEVSGGPGGTLTIGWQTGTSKNIGSQWAGYVYTWRIRARNSYGESGWSFAPTFIVRPGAPGNLGASTASCSQINLSWSDNSGNEEGYKVYRNGNVIATLSSGTTSYQDTGLSQSTNYPYFVRAYRGSVESNSSNTANATTSTCPVSPDTPSNFRVSSSTQTGITLAWDNVSNETGYKIYEWNGSTFVYLGSVGANVTSFTETRNGCGWDEFYEVSAYNGNGESAHANWIRGYTLPCTPALSVPGNLSINPPNYDLNFEWNSASGATEYLVEWWGGPYTTMQPCGWSSVTACHIGTVISGNTYSWHVKARNTAGESPWSPTWAFTIQPQTFTLTLNKTGTGSGTVTSNPAGINCGSDCSEVYSNNASVTLTASPAAGSTFTGWSAVGCPGTGTCTVTMTAATTVTANFSGNRPGEFSKNSPANGATNQPTSLTLTWAPSAGATSYAYCYDTTNDNACSNWTANGISTTKALTGLSSNTTYYWHVRAFNSFGVTYANGATTAFWSFRTGSGGPGDFSKSSPANGAINQPTSLTLTWMPSSGAGTYAYCYDTTNDNACSNWTSNGAATSKALTGLSPNTTYYWHVRAFNSLGARYSNGSTTAFWSFSTGSGAPGAFSKSNPANAATNQPLSLTLTWQASPGATFYAYCYDTTNDNTCSGWTAIGNTTSKALTGLSPNTTYYWHIRAFNSLSSTFSNGSSTAYWSFSTGNGAPGAFSKNSPANGVTNQPLSLTLTWAPSPGATFYAYCYDTTNDNSCSNWTAIGNTTSKVLSGLSPNTTYYWHIRAFNSYSATFSNGSATAFWSFRTGG